LVRGKIPSLTTEKDVLKAFWESNEKSWFIESCGHSATYAIGSAAHPRAVYAHFAAFFQMGLLGGGGGTGDCGGCHCPPSFSSLRIVLLFLLFAISSLMTTPTIIPEATEK